MSWVGAEELQGGVGAERCRSALLTGLVAGGGEGDICDEDEALGGPVMQL